MTDPSRVHYFRDLHIKGINWRPTHFVDEVPVSRLCALCLTIPRRTMLLPCEHFLCEKCFAFKSHDGFGLCPLDETFFEEAECDSYDLPITAAKAFQVYCWNKDHGCDFKGALKDMLKHCRNDCAFRSCDNLQCGEAVVNEKIGTRQVAECSTTVSSACTESMSSDCGALTLQDVRNALNEVETSLMKPNQDKVPPATECRMNELTEQAGNQESRLVEAAGEVGSSVAAETAQPAATPSPTVSQEPASRLNPAEEASVSQSSASCSQKMLRKEEPEIFSIISRNLLTRMQKTSTEDFPQHCIDPVNLPRGACRLTLTKPLSTTRTWKVLGTATYVITFENCPFLLTESRTTALYRHSVAYEGCKLHPLERSFRVPIPAFGCVSVVITCRVNEKETGRKADCLKEFFTVKANEELYKGL
ncbi:hypothetical protein HPB51_000714 [Rhipicephalus microplus]|uniref:RING-type domain-containing protein n=1 Tax=Rhipicephalus microplus TaxID=6941 RepID=A0A9J6E4R4_RHIMP|nr:hypothetical protein HPB51_000714 [Rhipicephalus microplus]